MVKEKEGFCSSLRGLRSCLVRTPSLHLPTRHPPICHAPSLTAILWLIPWLEPFNVWFLCVLSTSVRSCNVICMINTCTFLYFFALYHTSTHMHICTYDCTWCITDLTQTHTTHTTNTMRIHAYLRILGSYEKTGWTDQLSRPKKKPRTRFQTLPTSPGGPIIGLNFIFKIDCVKFHTWPSNRW